MKTLKNEQQHNLALDLGETRYTEPNSQHISMLLKHYRATGFPYTKLSDKEKLDEFNALQFIDCRPLLDSDDNFYPDSTGVSLANSYHRHRYGVVCNDHRTALYVFGRDHLLRKCLEKCVKMSGEVNDAKLRSMISIFEGVQVASNFPPGTAKAIYEHFLPNGGYVWDMSCGFGGRLLAALACDRVVGYYGTDPSTATYTGLMSMLDDIKRLVPDLQQGLKIGYMKVDIQNQGSEVALPKEWLEYDRKFDLCFTSPPYFNAEKYAREETQSFLAYSSCMDWINKFVGGTMTNCRKMIVDHGRVVVNIANVKTFPDLERAFVKKSLECGFELEKTMHLLYTAMPGKGSRNRQSGGKTKYRTEPIFVFKPV